MMLPAAARSALPSCSNSRVPSSTTITSECWMRCAGLGAVPAGCMVSCTATDSPLASVPLKALRPTEPLGAVFAGVSSKEKARAVARGFVLVVCAQGTAEPRPKIAGASRILLIPCPPFPSGVGRTCFPGGRRAISGLDVQVLYAQRVVFDEFAAGFHVFCHEGGEGGLGFGNVLELH